MKRRNGLYERKHFILYNANRQNNFYCQCEAIGKCEEAFEYHGYQSFAPGEATPELAHEIGLALAKKLWGEKYQVLVTTHLDKAHHLHNHFVVNTVSFVDGIKYYTPSAFLWATGKHWG